MTDIEDSSRLHMQALISDTRPSLLFPSMLPVLMTGERNVREPTGEVCPECHEKHAARMVVSYGRLSMGKMFFLRDAALTGLPGRLVAMDVYSDRDRSLAHNRG